MSILKTFFQAGEALKQLGSGTAFQHPEITTELSDDIRATIERDVLPLLEPLEQFRLEKLASKTRRKTLFRRLGWLLWLPSLALDLFMLVSGEPTLYTLFVVGGLGAWVVYPELQYTRHYKQKLIPVLLQAFGDHTYDKDGCIDLEAVKSFDILPRFSSKSSEDYISGNIAGVQFEFCELKLKRRGRKSNTTVHGGGALLIVMPFQFTGYTVVDTDYGKVGNRLVSPLAKSRVALENPMFEDRFEVYGSDQQYARYLLSPSLMERIIALDELFRARAKGTGITCEFRDNKALFMLSYFGDLLDVADIDVSAYDLDKMPLLEQELAMITDIIQQLKLDSLAARNVASTRLAEG
ncbi:MAG: DUF3137 domain-containing protein [Vreelandella alkaliphila]|uniref:DUF3137 domain-containing protein n=2 Tax=Halomonadaceae TaxID=28256 RepID=A0A3D0KEC6_9GAMM|nr:MULTISPECIES: DUF3137 domain-containing protein [unclassified Halomonas]WKD27018.1 DUF3137 domain-containing protein [Halomonas sp. KG2]HBP41472.1 hypothetical protein [Halomonas sp.]HBS82401.1 hypothetical protein [Halomonas campaniensis]HCA01794.1 hypothetical protein [Halomonas campaniensis]